MSKVIKKYSWFNVIFWSILYLLFFSWLQLWIAIPGVFIIIDFHISKIIPWKILNFKRLAGQKIWAIFEWLFVIIFALTFTLALRTLFIEAYKIPTPSMEKTLLVGDYLFVSKLAYGPKLPNTPLAAPFMPNLLPNGRKTYSQKLDLPYKRLLGFGQVKRNDIIVFNFPEGDTLVTQYSGQNYYSLQRQYGRDYIESHYDLISHPVDMRDNYIKRCVGIPGDTISIKQTKVWVNSMELPEISKQQYKYYLRTERFKLDDSILTIIGRNNNEISYNPANSLHTLTLSNNDVEFLKELPDVSSIQRYVEPRISFKNTEVFPHRMKNRWTADNFGPLIIPEAGMTMPINEENFPVYKRIIQVYEANKTEVINGDIYINDVLSRSYTFRMNYYFVLGDNRHNSADSRYWGFVPENHLVGKAIWIWYSKDPNENIFKGLRFKRMFKTIK